MKLLKGKELYKKIKGLNLNFHDYLSYLNEEKYTHDWKGISIQQESVYTYEVSQKYTSIKEHFLLTSDIPYDRVIINNFVTVMKLFINTFTTVDCCWIILRDNNRKRWVSNVEKTSSAANNMIKFFIKENVNFDFRGAFYLNSSSLINILPYLISLPYYDNSGDINLLNEDCKCIIRFTHHLSIDFIYIKAEGINDFLSKLKSLGNFKLVKYR